MLDLFGNADSVMLLLPDSLSDVEAVEIGVAVLGSVAELLVALVTLTLSDTEAIGDGEAVGLGVAVLGSVVDLLADLVTLIDALGKCVEVAIGGGGGEATCESGGKAGMGAGFKLSNAALNI